MGVHLPAGAEKHNPKQFGTSTNKAIRACLGARVSLQNRAWQQQKAK
jgi:hypothetical protein